MDTKGNWLIEPTFKDAEPYQDGMDRVLYPNKESWGYTDTAGEIRIKPKYRDNLCSDYSEGLALVAGADFGFIDKDGKRVIDLLPYIKDEDPPFITFEANEFSCGLAGFVIEYGGYNSYLLYFDHLGNLILKINDSAYKAFLPFAEGYASIFNQRDGWEIINLFGSSTIEPAKLTRAFKVEIYDCFSDELVPAKIVYADVPQHVGYLNHKGEIVYSEE